MSDIDSSFNIDGCIDAKSIREKLHQFAIMQQYPLEPTTYNLITALRHELEQRLAKLD